VGITAPTVEARWFLKDFQLAIREYKNAVDELLVYNYLFCTRADKLRPVLRKGYYNTVIANDNFRIRQAETMKCQAFDRAWERCEARATYLQQKDELALLQRYQVAINLSLPEGVLLHRRLRDWICADISNERAEVEMFMNGSFMVLFGGVLFMGYLWLQNFSLTSMGTVIIFDSFLLALHVLRAVNLCADANQYLFTGYQQCLLGWLLNLQECRSAFPNDKPAIGWIWDSEKGKAVPLPFDFEESERLVPESAREHRSVRQCLKLSAQLVQVYEERQRILGMKVTPELRARLAVSFATSVAATLASIPSLIYQHYDEIESEVQNHMANFSQYVYAYG
jgi:hypothetical protein